VLGEVLTASVTPFDSEGAVNLTKFRELAAFLVENGSDGLVVTGSTGESATLTDDERIELYSAAVDTVGDRATVIAGTGTYDTRHSVHLTKQAHELGVDGFLVVTPYYNKPPPRGIVEHVKAIAAVTDKPIVYYNIPARVVVKVDVETLAELAEIPNVVAVKQAWDDLEDARRIVEETGLQLYAGDDNLIQAFLELGAMGGICVHTHVVGPDRPGACACLRDPEGRRQPDCDQGCAEPPRPRGRRPAAAARRGHGAGAEPDPRLPGAPRSARARHSINR
jgi:4-hydroxy-tetrahydrodipicolinate synthase